MSTATTHTDKGESLVSGRYVFISLSISLLALAAIVYWTYAPGILDDLKPKRLPGLLIALMVSFLRIGFMAAKLRFLSENVLTWMGALRVSLIWDFASLVSPSTVGGAPAATVAMTYEKMPLGKSTALTLYTVLLDQIWFAISIPVLIFLGLFLDIIPDNVGSLGEGIMLVVYVLLLGYAGILTYAVLFNPRALSLALSKIFSLSFLRKHKPKIDAQAEILEASATELGNKPAKFVLIAFLFAGVVWLARIWIASIVLLSFGPADVLLSFLRSFAMQLAGFFIPTPGGSGGIEGLYALFMGTLLDNEAYIGLAVFMWRIIGHYVSLGLGMWAAFWYVRHGVSSQKDTV